MISVLYEQVKAISMDIPFRHSEKIKLNQNANDLTPQAVDRLALAILLVPEKPGRTAWERLPYAEVLKPRWQRRRDRDSDCLVTDLPNKAGTRIILQTVKPDSDAFAGLCRARGLADTASKLDPAVVGCSWPGLTRPRARACWNSWWPRCWRPPARCRVTSRSRNRRLHCGR